MNEFCRYLLTRMLFQTYTTFLLLLNIKGEFFIIMNEFMN